MALRPPGSRSNLELLIYGAAVLAQVAILIGGHVMIGYLLLGAFGINNGMADITETTGLPEPAVWAIAVAAIAMDCWSFYHRRKQRKKALQR